MAYSSKRFVKYKMIADAIGSCTGVIPTMKEESPLAKQIKNLDLLSWCLLLDLAQHIGNLRRGSWQGGWSCGTICCNSSSCCEPPPVRGAGSGKVSLGIVVWLATIAYWFVVGGLLIGWNGVESLLEAGFVENHIMFCFPYLFFLMNPTTLSESDVRSNAQQKASSLSEARTLEH